MIELLLDWQLGKSERTWRIECIGDFITLYLYEGNVGAQRMILHMLARRANFNLLRQEALNCIDELNKAYGR